MLTVFRSSLTHQGTDELKEEIDKKGDYILAYTNPKIRDLRVK